MRNDSLLTLPVVRRLKSRGARRRWETGDLCLRPEEGADWKRGGLYEPCLLEHKGVYYLFHNAKTCNLPQPQGGGWGEQIGVATSTDLKHRKRYEGNRIVAKCPPGSPVERFASAIRACCWAVPSSLGAAKEKLRCGIEGG